MLYNNKSELINLLKSKNLYTEKKFGQNFLFNTNIVEKIIETADIKQTDHIIEVGPGLGILSIELAKKAGKLTVIEKDPKLISHLTETFKTFSNIEIINRDILTTKPPQTPYKVVANIPYYITSPILTHFLNRPIEQQPKTMTLMTQLEVAQKICANRGDHSVLSLCTQLYAFPKIIQQVSPDNFFPAPKVNSAIIRLETRQTPQIDHPDLFIKIIKKAFSQKRKTLGNSLSSMNGFNKTSIEQLLVKADLKANIRPQNLDFDDWNRLTTLFMNTQNSP